MSTCGTGTVVVGFDALSMRYLDAFDLPNFDSLRERGVTTTLRSTFPPWTGSAWPSLYTGVGPDHHGVYSFFNFTDRYPDEAELICRNDVRAPALWNYFSELGYSSVVLNVPGTHPPEFIDGVLVPGYLAPEGASGHPEGIRDELEKAIGQEYRIYSDRETGDGDEGTLESFEALIDLRRRAAEYLLKSRDPAVAILQVQKTDTVFHQFDDRRAFRRIYEAADAFLGTVLETVADDADVIVCSDHGIGPVTGYNVYVNEILRRDGLVVAERNGVTPTLGVSKRRLARGDGDTGGHSTLAGRVAVEIASVLSEFGIEPGDVYGVAQHVGADGFLKRWLPSTEEVSLHVDWTRSRAYCRSGPELGVRINLEGREPNGIVPSREYEEVRDKVIETLSNVRTPDGEPVFDWVRSREAVYDGPWTEVACDVLFEPVDMNHIVATNLLGKRFIPIDKHNHKNEGVFVGAGPGFDQNAAVDGLSITDVGPIVMALTGSPVPERMTGSIPSGLLVEPVVDHDYGEISYGTEETMVDDGAVEARLEDLGYL